MKIYYDIVIEKNKVFNNFGFSQRLDTPASETIVVIVSWKGIHSRSNTNRTGAKGLFFYYSRLLYCPDQILVVMVLSQHGVSSSKNHQTSTPSGAQCIGYIIRKWSAVCSEALHSQFNKGVRSHLCMDIWNCPTPVHRQLSLTQAVQASSFQQAWHGFCAWMYFHSILCSIYN